MNTKPTTVQVSPVVRAQLDEIAAQLRAEKQRPVAVTETIEYLIESRASLVAEVGRLAERNSELAEEIASLQEWLQEYQDRNDA